MTRRDITRLLTIVAAGALLVMLTATWALGVDLRGIVPTGAPVVFLGFAILGIGSCLLGIGILLLGFARDLVDWLVDRRLDRQIASERNVVFDELLADLEHPPATIHPIAMARARRDRSTTGSAA